MDEESSSPAMPLWSGDTGSLSEGSRRALVELVKGPYLSGRGSPAQWSALLADELVIRERLHDLFLDLVVDPIEEFAFVRNVRTDELATPQTVRNRSLTFMDTAMLLVLRQLFLAREGGGRIIVGREEVFDQLQVYRSPGRDELDFSKRMNSSWQKMRNVLRVTHAAGAGDEDRVEISPVLRLIVDADHVRQISVEYARIAAGTTGGAEPPEHADEENPNDSEDNL